MVNSVTRKPSSLRAKATRGAIWSGGGSIMLRLGSLLVGVILARILTPEQFGVYAVALTVQGILMTVADFGLTTDIIRSDDPDRIAPTVATMGLVTGVGLTALTIVSAPLLADALGSPDASPAIAVLSFTLLLGGAGVVPVALLTRRFQQREFFFLGVIDFIISTTVTLVLVGLGWGVMGLAFGRVTAQVVSTTLQFFVARVKPRYAIDRTVLRPVLAFSAPIAAANLLSWAVLNVDNIVLARVAGAVALGFYVLAFNISSWPTSALSAAVQAIAMPYFSRAESVERGMLVVTALTWSVALPMGLGLAVISEPLIDIVYGAKWLPAAPVLAALGLHGSLRVIFNIFTEYLYSRGRSRPVLWIQIAWLVVLVVGMIFATSRWGIVGAGWVHVVLSAGVILPAYLFVLRRNGVRLRSLARALARPTLATLPAVAGALLCRLLIPAPLPALLAAVAVAVVVYAALMWSWLMRMLRQVRGGTPAPSGAGAQEQTAPQTRRQRREMSARGEHR